MARERLEATPVPPGRASVLLATLAFLLWEAKNGQESLRDIVHSPSLPRRIRKGQRAVLQIRQIVSTHMHPWAQAAWPGKSLLPVAS